VGRYGGVDIGTSSVKVGVYDESGRRLGFERRPHPTIRPLPGHAEQDPNAWLHAVRGCLTEAGPLDGISFGGLMSTFVPVGGDGVSLGMAVTWEDQRRPADLPDTVPTSSYRSRSDWFRQTNPDVWSQSRWLLLPKDYVILGLAGGTIGDVLSWNGVLKLDGSGLDPDLDEEARSRIPTLGPPDATVASRFGPLRIGLPDAVAAVVGCGLDTNTAYSISGTSEVIAILSDVAESSRDIRSVVPLCGRWLHAGPSSSGGMVLEWAAKILTSGDVAGLSHRAQQSAHRNPPLFVPYLSGERAPMWNSRLKGAFLDLEADHTTDDLCFAVLEGVQFAVRRLLAAVEGSTRVSTQRMRGAGGSLSDPFIAQLRADRCNRMLEVAADPETASRGAACLAAAGVIEKLEETASRFSASRLVYEPRASHFADERFQRWFRGTEHLTASAT